MPRQDRVQEFRDGVMISDTPVSTPLKVVSDADFATARQNLKTYFTTFTNNGTPTGTPSAAQNRNAILSLIVVARHLYNEMDNE